MRNLKIIIILLTFLGCTVSIPNNQDDICQIIDENPRWENILFNAQQKWGAEPSTVMAIIRQESSFKPNAAPDREKILGVIPWKRPTSAKGYAQAVNSTWKDYKKETGNSRASRSSFNSSVDFIGWYLSKAASARIQPQEVDKLYLAYHEGYGGYKRETYKDKSWLIDTARKVKFNSLKYKRQLNSCPVKQKRSWWNIFN